MAEIHIKKKNVKKAEETNVIEIVMLNAMMSIQ
jgi:hypothetical protein